MEQQEARFEQRQRRAAGRVKVRNEGEDLSGIKRSFSDTLVSVAAPPPAAASYTKATLCTAAAPTRAAAGLLPARTGRRASSVLSFQVTGTGGSGSVATAGESRARASRTADTGAACGALTRSCPSLEIDQRLLFLAREVADVDAVRRRRALKKMENFFRPLPVSAAAVFPFPLFPCNPHPSCAPTPYASDVQPDGRAVERPAAPYPAPPASLRSSSCGSNVGSPAASPASVSRGSRPALSLQQFERVWLMLFYAAWLSDKPLVQRELFVRLALLQRLLHAPEEKRRFFKAFFLVMERQWHALDQHRLDKFLLFVRVITAELTATLVAACRYYSGGAECPASGSSDSNTSPNCAGGSPSRSNTAEGTISCSSIEGGPQQLQKKGTSKKKRSSQLPLPASVGEEHTAGGASSVKKTLKKFFLSPMAKFFATELLTGPQHQHGAARGLRVQFIHCFLAELRASAAVPSAAADGAAPPAPASAICAGGPGSDTASGSGGPWVSPGKKKVLRKGATQAQQQEQEHLKQKEEQQQRAAKQEQQQQSCNSSSISDVSMLRFVLFPFLYAACYCSDSVSLKAVHQQVRRQGTDWFSSSPLQSNSTSRCIDAFSVSTALQVLRELEPSDVDFCLLVETLFSLASASGIRVENRRLLYSTVNELERKFFRYQQRQQQLRQQLQRSVAMTLPTGEACLSARAASKSLLAQASTAAAAAAAKQVVAAILSLHSTSTSSINSSQGSDSSRSIDSNTRSTNNQICVADPAASPRPLVPVRKKFRTCQEQTYEGARNASGEGAKTGAVTVVTADAEAARVAEAAAADDDKQADQSTLSSAEIKPCVCSVEERAVAFPVKRRAACAPAPGVSCWSSASPASSTASKIAGHAGRSLKRRLSSTLVHTRDRIVTGGASTIRSYGEVGGEAPAVEATAPQKYLKDEEKHMRGLTLGGRPDDERLQITAEEQLRRQQQHRPQPQFLQQKKQQPWQQQQNEQQQQPQQRQPQQREPQATRKAMRRALSTAQSTTFLQENQRMQATTCGVPSVAEHSLAAAEGAEASLAVKRKDEGAVGAPAAATAVLHSGRRRVQPSNVNVASHRSTSSSDRSSSIRANESRSPSSSYSRQSSGTGTSSSRAKKDAADGNSSRRVCFDLKKNRIAAFHWLQPPSAVSPALSLKESLPGTTYSENVPGVTGDRMHECAADAGGFCSTPLLMRSSDSSAAYEGTRYTSTRTAAAKACSTNVVGNSNAAEKAQGTASVAEAGARDRSTIRDSSTNAHLLHSASSLLTVPAVTSPAAEDATGAGKAVTAVDRSRGAEDAAVHAIGEGAASAACSGDRGTKNETASGGMTVPRVLKSILKKRQQKSIAALPSEGTEGDEHSIAPAPCPEEIQVKLPANENSAVRRFGLGRSRLRCRSSKSGPVLALPDGNLYGSSPSTTPPAVLVTARAAHDAAASRGDD